MAFQATPRGIEVKLVMSQNDVPVVNRWNVDAGHTTVTLTDLEDAQVVFDQWLTDFYAPAIHSSVIFEQWVLTALDVEGGEQLIVVPTTGAGLGGGDPAAANAALVVSFRTGHIGRSNRGRSYVPGLLNAYFADAQHLETTVTSAFITTFTELIDALNAISMTLSVLSRVLNGVQRVVGLLIAINELIVDTKVDSQRRRTAN